MSLDADTLRRNRALRKKRQRARRRARELGYDYLPKWVWHHHERDCQCYDCLWAPFPWEQDTPATVRRVS